MEKLIFKRLNFFKGLFTKAEDWLAEQRYHIEKHKLQNRCFHTRGVVTGEGSDLRVKVNDRLLTVQPGYAIDGQGRDLYLSEPNTLSIPSEKEGLIYIYIAYAQKGVETRSNSMNPDHSGDAFMLEYPIVDWTDQPLDNYERIELARIKVKAAQPITDKDIDTRNVSYASSRLRIRVRRGHSTLSDKTTRRERLIRGPQQAKEASEESRGLELESDTVEGRVLIERFSDLNEAARAHYFAIVCAQPDQPLGVRISWRIETILVEGDKKFQFLLVMKGSKEVEVDWLIYRVPLTLVLTDEQAHSVTTRL